MKKPNKYDYTKKSGVITKKYLYIEALEEYIDYLESTATAQAPELTEAEVVEILEKELGCLKPEWSKDAIALLVRDIVKQLTKKGT